MAILPSNWSSLVQQCNISDKGMGAAVQKYDSYKVQENNPNPEEAERKRTQFDRKLLLLGTVKTKYGIVERELSRGYDAAKAKAPEIAAKRSEEQQASIDPRDVEMEVLAPFNALMGQLQSVAAAIAQEETDINEEKKAHEDYFKKEGYHARKILVLIQNCNGGRLNVPCQISIPSAQPPVKMTGAGKVIIQGVYLKNEKSLISLTPKKKMGKKKLNGSDGSLVFKEGQKSTSCTFKLKAGPEEIRKTTAKDKKAAETEVAAEVGGKANVYVVAEVNAKASGRAKGSSEKEKVTERTYKVSVCGPDFAFTAGG